ncbi:uncharacterized protein M6B38_207600 [Iris pallida]|uniref:S-adenosyl-L-methionine-dependent methyltransferase n=1 Tax=Iris pallida TaxID=29817 RepID=A0AAX6E5Q3_IRIPA|nr:Uncharacterized protein M6B38_110360 [Iris pallida]KAJ6799344.1 uncharacterized protein M6B38_207600 [Iris pallida]
MTKMERACLCKCRFSRALAYLQIILGFFVVIASITSLHRLYSTGLLFDPSSKNFQTIKEGYADFDLKSLSDRFEEGLTLLAALQDKLEAAVHAINKNKTAAAETITRSELKMYLEEEVISPLYSAHISLRLIRIPKPEAEPGPGLPMEDPLINFFTVEEMRKYITAKGNKNGKVSLYGTNKTYGTVGHACVLMRKELEEYMNYDIANYCKDDWHLGQKLMLGGCDPLPRRRCLARASKLYQRPLPINESLWTMPDHRNVRWNNYRCRNFECLSSKNPRRGFSKCTGCFELDKEKVKWLTNSTLADFLIDDVLAVKPGEIRIGVDISVGTGSFAARMRERNVTIISTAMNIGAPFNEMIALRGLVPLYMSLGQRLPFFDNTMDLIHTSVFLDGWVDLQLLDFMLFDWDRVLRPGGLLWIDKFFCKRKDLDDYMYMILQFRYRKHKWAVSFKSNVEVYLSALLEKPPRSL